MRRSRPRIARGVVAGVPPWRALKAARVLAEWAGPKEEESLQQADQGVDSGQDGAVGNGAPGSQERIAR